MKRAAKALIRDDQGNILVLYRSQTHPYLAHDIDLPGGEIEHLERLEKGVSREVLEETGITIPFRRHQRMHVWRPARIARRYHLYETSLDNRPEVIISWEHESYEWMPEDEFVQFEALDGFIHQVQAWLNRGN